MSECLFFQDSTLVRLVGKDGKGFTTQVLISSASPWVGELMSSISPQGEQCIILPDVAWKDISGLLIQSEPSKAKSDYLLDLFRTTTGNVIHNVKQSRTILQRRIIGNDSVKQEECQESTFNEHVKQKDIGETTLNANANVNLNKPMRTVHKVLSENKDSNIIDKVVNSSTGRTCNRCDKSFSSVVNLKMHKRNVHKVIFEKKDPSRSTKYRRLKKLDNILRSPNIHLYELDKIEGLLSCNECSEKFAIVKTLNEHKEKQHPVYFSCDYCQFTSTEEHKLKSHRHSVHGDVSESCEMCDKKFEGKWKLRKLSTHKRIDHALVRFPCNRCDYRAKSGTYLKIHLNAVHEKIILTCEKCAKTYTNPRNLRQHQQSVHNGVFFMCDQCDYKGTQRRNLQHHIEKVHEGT